MKRFLVLFCLLFVLMSSGCVDQANDSGGNSSAPQELNFSYNTVERLEIFHFHRTRQCYSCITLGQYAEETLNTYFADELESGRIVFGHVNVQLPENAELAEKYGAAGSSLWIGVYDENGFHAEENINVWYKINDRDEFIEYLKGVVEEKLGGE